ncbi:MAG: DUF3987 domain-containing protein, partial [Actinomycetota bacterium]|nr:DUF3987 domain-containing protein [Actinomycetota bacterium]
MSPLKDAALASAAKGIPLFPVWGVGADGVCECPRGAGCKTPGKHPVHEGGHHNATTDPEQIHRWWDANPNANIGSPTGRETGLLVIDVDAKTAGALDELERLGLPADAPRVRTGGGGFHVYLAYPDDYEVKSGSKNLRGVLDTRGKGGYVLLPPSRNVSGSYEWVRERNGHLPPVPEHLAEELKGAEDEKVRDKFTLSERIPEGYRDDTMFRLASSFRAKGLEEDEIYEALKAVNANRCDPPMTDEELRAKAKSAAKYAPGELTGRRGNAGRPPAPEFPLDALPKRAARLCKETARSLSAPVDLVAAPSLAVLASAVGNSRRARVKPGWDEAPSLYIVQVAPPGGAKTPALNQAQRPATKEQARLKDVYHAQKKEYEKALRENACKPNAEKGDVPQEPKLQTTYVSDTTVEALGPVLEANPRGVLLIRDEMEALVSGLNQYKAGGKGNDRHFFKSTWSGSQVRIDRKTADEPLILDSPYVSITGGIQPAMLHTLGGDRDDGFMDRFLLAFPEPKPSRFTREGISEEARKDYDDLYLALRKLDQEPHSSVYTLPEDPDHRPLCVYNPQIVEFSPDALALFGEKYDEIEREKESLPSRLQGVWAKLPSYLARFALLLVLCREAEER